MGCVSWVGSVVKAAIGEGPARGVCGRRETGGQLQLLWRLVVGIVGAIGLQQSMPLEFAKVVAKWLRA
jgi:hypothetical protein